MEVGRGVWEVEFHIFVLPFIFLGNFFWDEGHLSLPDPLSERTLTHLNIYLTYPEEKRWGLFTSDEKSGGKAQMLDLVEEPAPPLLERAILPNLPSKPRRLF